MARDHGPTSDQHEHCGDLVETDLTEYPSQSRIQRLFVATTAPDNLASRRLLGKLGARQLDATERGNDQDKEENDDWAKWLEWEIRPE